MAIKNCSAGHRDRWDTSQMEHGLFMVGKILGNATVSEIPHQLLHTKDTPLYIVNISHYIKVSQDCPSCLTLVAGILYRSTVIQFKLIPNLHQ